MGIVVGVIILLMPISYLISRWTGCVALARRYRIDRASGIRYRLFWLAIGHPSIDWRWGPSPYVFVREEGLCLEVSNPFWFWRQAVMIPWGDIQYQGDKRYFGANLSKFSLGLPPITTLFLWKGTLSEQIRSKVSQALQEEPPASFSKATGRAQLALVFGILSFLCFGPLAGIPALVLAFEEQRAIEKGEAPVAEKKVVKVASILGVVGMAFWFLLVIGLSWLSKH